MKFTLNLKKLILLTTLIALTTQIFGENLNKYDYIKLDISNEISFQTQIDSKHSISKFNINSYFFPKSYNGSQYLNDFKSSNSDHQILDQNNSIFIRYDFSKTLKESNKIKNNFIIESTTNKPKIENKINYPIDLQEIENPIQQYLDFSSLVDSDENIKNKATELASGEDDLFVISTKIANYITKYITYDLTTVLENPNQKSSEVFISQQGVCKEITNLYVSMMRSLKIPTRFVTGYAYTTSEDVVNYVGSNWGGHVWAEVLIDGTWVPFDLTYHQYGFVDSTHIVTDKSQFIRNNGVTLDALSSGIQIVPNSLKLKNNFNLLEQKETLFDNGFEITLQGPQEIGFDSYGYIKAEIKNTKPYYQNIFLKFAKPQEVQYLNENENIHIFKPFETKILHFQYKIPELDKKYLYTFPFLIYNDFIEKNFEIKVASKYNTISKINLENQQDTTPKKYYTNNNLRYNCDYDLKNQKFNIECKIKNPNNFELKDIEICLEENCQKTTLRINEEKPLTFHSETKEVILYSKYSNKQEKLQLSLKYPKLLISEKINYQSLNLNIQIYNHLTELKTKIIIDNTTIYDNYANPSQDYNLNLNPGKQNLKIILHANNIEFDTYETTLEIEKTPLSEKINQFIEKIKNFFKN